MDAANQNSADLLAGASINATNVEPRSVQVRWPDGFGVTSRLDEYCSIAKALKDAAWCRREYLERRRRDG